jgi:hypothetical protein
MRPHLSLLLLSAATALAVDGQTPLKLKPANSTLSAEFTGVTSLRELSDGRVIIGDGRDQTLWVADFTTDRTEPIGRKGRGPGEYTFVGWVRPIGGDSSLMGDILQRRWLVLNGARLVGVVPPDHPAVAKTHGSVSFADQRGYVLFLRPIAEKAGVSEISTSDSTAVELISRNTGKVDTVSMLRPLPRRRTIAYGPDGRITSSSSRVIDLWAREESAILLPDGSLAVVRLDPLRVDWRSPDGVWRLGRPLPVKPLRLDQRERDGINARRTAAGSVVMRSTRGGERLSSSPPLTEFPPFLPLIAMEPATLVSASGQVLIRRNLSVALPGTRYLVVNRKGTLDGELVLGDKAYIRGFGSKSVYVVTVDDDDIQHMSRHPWP